jgi:DNA polymerase/3'-5' exonuclease PolX
MMLFAKTGSDAHVEKLAAYANKEKISLAVSEGRTKRAPRTEEEIYKRFGMQYVTPELREDAGENRSSDVGSLMKTCWS